MSTLWVDKYKPKSINELVLDQHIINKLEKIAEDKEMPNMLIAGISGNGKTATVNCLINSLFGNSKKTKEYIYELNAFDERGIKATHDAELFCKKKVIGVNHKLVVLDEADNITNKSQRIINELMETYHKTTRFIFTCNNSADLIEAIQSKCVILHYPSLTNSQITSKLEFICRTEKLQYTPGSLDKLAEIARGDMRNAINLLQLNYINFGNITEKNIYVICDISHIDILKKVFIMCHNKNIKDAYKLLFSLRTNGFSVSDITMNMFNVLKSPTFTELTDEVKIKFINNICKSCIIVSKGIETDLQLSGCLANLLTC